VRISTVQREALALIAANRVTYGDAHPRTTALAVDRGANPWSAWLPVFMVDGAEVYDHRHVTFRGLVRRGLAAGGPAEDGTPVRVSLTDAGRTALEE